MPFNHSPAAVTNLKRAVNEPNPLTIDKSPRAILTALVARKVSARDDRQASESQLIRLARLLGTRRISGRVYTGAEDLRIDKLEHPEYAMLDGMSVASCHRHTVNLLKVAYANGNTFDSDIFVNAVEALRVSLGALVKPIKAGVVSIVKETDIINASSGITQSDVDQYHRHIAAVKLARKLAADKLAADVAERNTHRNGPVIKRARLAPSANGASVDKVPATV